MSELSSGSSLGYQLYVCGFRLLSLHNIIKLFRLLKLR